MGGCSVVALMGIFSGAVIAVGLFLIGAISIAIAGLIALIVGIIVNAVSLKKNKKKSIPAIITMAVGGAIVVPSLIILILILVL